MLNKITSGFIALLLTVFLLAFPSEGYTAIPEFKYALFLLICGGYIIVIALLRTSFVIVGMPPKTNLHESIKTLSLPMKFLFCFLLFTILSSILSTYPETFRGAFRQEGTLTIGIYILMCFFVANYFRPKLWMLIILSISVILTCVLAFIQLTGANPFTLYPLGLNYYGAGIYYSGEFLSTIGNAGFFAGFISLISGILAMSMIKLESRLRWFLSVPFFLAILIVFSIGIDAAIVAVLVGFVLMLPVAVTSQKTLIDTLIVLSISISAFILSQVLTFQDGPVLFAPIRLPIIFAFFAMVVLAIAATRIELLSTFSTNFYRKIATATVFGIICFSFVFLLQYSGTSGSWIYEASQVLRGNWDDTFGTRRVFIWRNIIEGIQMQTLLLGTGPDTLGFWDIEPFSRYVEHTGFTIVTIIDAAHNEFLHILAVGGVLSLLAYLGALIFAAIGWVRQTDNHLSAITGTGVLFYVIQSFFGISQFVTAPFFWVCLGALLSTQKIPSESKQLTEGKKHIKSKTRKHS